MIALQTTRCVLIINCERGHCTCSKYSPKYTLNRPLRDSDELKEGVKKQSKEACNALNMMSLARQQSLLSNASISHPNGGQVTFSFDY